MSVQSGHLLMKLIFGPDMILLTTGVITLQILISLIVTFLLGLQRMRFGSSMEVDVTSSTWTNCAITSGGRSRSGGAALVVVEAVQKRLHIGAKALGLNFVATKGKDLSIVIK